MEAFVEQCVLRIKDREAREAEEELQRFLEDARLLRERERSDGARRDH